MEGVVKVPARISPEEVLSKGREVSKREAEYRALVRRPGATLEDAQAWKSSRGLM